MGTMMKKKIGNSSPKNTKSMKRMLKPVIEKKRRDRINQSLSELRILLLNYKLDSNPKLEKAEILDLAVEYLQKRTDKRSISNDCSSQAVCGPKEVQQVIHSEASMAGAPSPPTAAFPRSALPAIYTAGFQQCVSHLAGFMGSSSPLEKNGFILLQGLKSYIDSQCPTTNTSTAMYPSSQYPTTNTSTEQLQCPSSSSLTDIHLRLGGKETAHWADMVPVREGYHPSKQGAVLCLRKSTLSTTHHSFYQPNGHSYPLTPDYLSPLSPCLSCSSSVFTTPPPYSSFPCHFSFPPSLSPISSNPSSCSGSPSLHNVPSPPLGFSPTFPLSSPPGLPLPSPPLVPFPSHKSLWSPVPARRQELFISSTHWRPW